MFDVGFMLVGNTKSIAAAPSPSLRLRPSRREGEVHCTLPSGAELASARESSLWRGEGEACLMLVSCWLGTRSRLPLLPPRRLGSDPPGGRVKSISSSHRPNYCAFDQVLFDCLPQQLRERICAFESNVFRHQFIAHHQLVMIDGATWLCFSQCMLKL